MENLELLINSKSNWVMAYDIVFQYIKILLPYIFIIILSLIFRKEIKVLCEGISEIGFKDFNIKLLKNAEKLESKDIVKEIKSLTYDELSYFLIMCGEKSAYYMFRDDGVVNLRYKELLEGLNRKGLLELERNPDKSFLIHQTEKGKKIHRIFMDTLYNELSN